MYEKQQGASIFFLCTFLPLNIDKLLSNPSLSFEMESSHWDIATRVMAGEGTRWKKETE